MRYRLLRPLPGIEVGRILDIPNDGHFDLGGACLHVPAWPDWFEPIIERWKPVKHGDRFFYVNEAILTCCGVRSYQQHEDNCVAMKALALRPKEGG